MALVEVQRADIDFEEEEKGVDVVSQSTHFDNGGKGLVSSDASTESRHRCCGGQELVEGIAIRCGVGLFSGAARAARRGSGSGTSGTGGSLRLLFFFVYTFVSFAGSAIGCGHVRV
ncbi:hypothetical protein C8J57DRAFT_1504814 [Mycena rebaudengoi]|nr:hypothetical protein C8J57DRAFT_1504814 [Mycena rebaudengoi]